MKTNNQLSTIGQAMITDDTPIPKFNSNLNLQFKIVFVFFLFFFDLFFCRPYTFKWSFWPTAGFLLVGFFACQTPFCVLTPLVTEFVVSPTHDYTTFSSYGSDVYTCVQFNLNFSFLSFFFCSFGDAGMLQFSFSLIFSVPFYCTF